MFTLDNVVIDGSNRVDHAIAADASCGAVIKDSVVRNFLGWGMAQTAFVASTVVRTRISGGTRGIFHQLSGLQLEDVTITGASEAGLYVIGGSTSCSPCVLSANGVGLDQRGGVVSFAGGSAITDNTGAGIALAGGTLAIGGSGPSGVEIAGNGAEGIIVGTSPSSVPYNASSLTLAGANVHDNVGPGLRVQNPFGPSGSPGVVGVSGCTFTNNGGANLRVDDSGVRVGADPISLRVNATTFIGSAHAVWLAGTTSSAVALSGSTLRDATDTAMLIEHLSPAWHVRLTGNELRHNAATTPRAGQLIGGFFAHSDAGWPADFVFEGNSLFSNTQHQMGLDVAGVTGPTSVSISFGALGCAGPANSFYCYANAPALSAAKGLVVSAGSNVTLSVDAGAANWQNGLSTAGLDDQLISVGACAVTGSACGGFAPMCPN
ncbi:MAG: right-handed parallel beta-helix repeat-containing protein [Deltaproteobacteria bacterium]|nr:right-handed parallel beta-helix repeat-containing protein [Deltaproteobacteria bacterium]